MMPPWRYAYSPWPRRPSSAAPSCALLRLVARARRKRAWSSSWPSRPTAASRGRARELGLRVHELPFGPLAAAAGRGRCSAWPRARALVRHAAAGRRVAERDRAAAARPGTRRRRPRCSTCTTCSTHRPRQWRRRAVLAARSRWSRARPRPSRARRPPAAPRASRLRVAPVPVEPVEPAPRPAWAGEGPVVGFVGRIEPRKGVLDLLAAARSLAARVPGRARRDRARARRSKPTANTSGAFWRRQASMGDTVLVTGPVDDARGLMPWFDVLCVPSLVEPFGTVAAEALAAGTPAVVTDSGGMPEYVTPGRSGEVVPPGDPEQLADALERVLARRARDGRRRARGRRTLRHRTRRRARPRRSLQRERGPMKVALDLRVLDDAGARGARDRALRVRAGGRAVGRGRRDRRSASTCRAGRAGADVLHSPSIDRVVDPPRPALRRDAARPRAAQVAGPLPAHRAEAPAALCRGQARDAGDRAVAGGGGRCERSCSASTAWTSCPRRPRPSSAGARAARPARAAAAARPIPPVGGRARPARPAQGDRAARRVVRPRAIARRWCSPGATTPRRRAARGAGPGRADRAASATRSSRRSTRPPTRSCCRPRTRDSA